MKKINAKIIVILGVIFVSFSAILAKLSQAPSLVIAMYRMMFTVLLMLPSLIMKRKEIKHVSYKIFILCIIGGMLLALHFATWITSLKYTSHYFICISYS
ncbi:hypothetical protein QBE52_12135 [Clostridiaceae bacterium 35-E11]